MGRALSTEHLAAVASVRMGTRLPYDDGFAESGRLIIACVETRIGDDCPVLGDLENRAVGGYPAGIAGIGQTELVAKHAQDPGELPPTFYDADAAVAVGEELPVGVDWSAHPRTCLALASGLKIFTRIADKDPDVLARAEEMNQGRLGRRLTSRLAGSAAFAIDWNIISSDGETFEKRASGRIPTGNYRGDPIPGHGYIVNETRRPMPRINPELTTRPVYIADHGVTKPLIERAGGVALGVSPKIRHTMRLLYDASLAEVLRVNHHQIRP